MDRPHRYQDIIDIKHDKPYLTWTAAAREAGFEVGNFTSSGKSTKEGKKIPKLKNKDARRRQAKNRALAMKFDKELLAEVERQEKLGNLKAEDYFADRQRRFDEYLNELKRQRKLGLKVDDGHMTTRDNNSPSARAPELSRLNQAKGATQPVNQFDMLEANLPTNDIDDLYHYMAPSGMAPVGTEERSRMITGEISGQQAAAIADQKFQLDQQRMAGLSRVQDVLASSTKRAGERIARNLVPGVGTAIEIQDTKQRFDEFKANPNLMNAAQFGTQAISSTANVASDFALATGVGAPLAPLFEKVSGLTTLADAMLQGVEEYLQPPTTPQ